MYASRTYFFFHCHYFPYLVLVFVFKFNCILGNRYFWRCMLEHTKRQVNEFLFSKMRFNVMFVTAVCVLFLIKLRWPKKKSSCFLFSILFYTWKHKLRKFMRRISAFFDIARMPHKCSSESRLNFGIPVYFVMRLNWEGVNGVNRLATKGEKILLTTDKTRKKLPTSD